MAAAIQDLTPLADHDRLRAEFLGMGDRQNQASPQRRLPARAAPQRRRDPSESPWDVPIDVKCGL